MPSSTLYHRDASGRVTAIQRQDAGRERFIRPSDGRLAPLLVQRSDEAGAYSETKGGWTRIGKMRLQVSPILDLVHWTYSSVLEEGSEERHYEPDAVIALLLKWIPSCIILAVMLLIPQNLEGNSRNNGFYDPVRYRDWGYAKASRNTAEDRDHELDEAEEPKESAPLLSVHEDIEMSALSHHTSRQSTNQSTVMEEEMDEEFDDLPARHFRPRYLCFLKDDGYETWRVTDWIQTYGDNADTDFVFLSYTRKQFCVATKPELDTWELPDEETRTAYYHIAQRDRHTLVQYGIEAARSVGARAFWLDFECLRDADNQAKAHSQSNDVYRICDIVRAAHSLAILLGPPLDSKLPRGTRQEYGPENMKQWLREWGTRLWTLPEILLSSPEYPVRIYAIGNPSSPERLARRNFAGRGAWKDAKLVRQLVDHYESSVHLTPLELVSIALECFSSRQTDQFHSGDLAYALMGLLRRRPAVNKSDSSFEAFARLSLANDSDDLLERLLCMQPVRPDAPWNEIRDAWGAHLWDIEPRCQVAGIVDDQTVTLDGAFGATIQWDNMDQVAFFKRPTLVRTFGKIVFRGVPVYLIFGLIFTITGAVLQGEVNKATSDSDDSSVSVSSDSSSSSPASSAALGLLIPGLIFLVPSLIITLLAPVMLLDIYRGKFWSTQALFVGVEGFVDIGIAERHLFGFNHGRLKWSTNGSTLSRHKYVRGECVPVPPAVGKAPAGHTLFTLIDTYAMTATCFYAERPPVAVIVCGHEGGMQRAVLCSYDWRRQTFARETVVRVKTLVLDRMFRMDRFRFALRRTPPTEDTKEQAPEMNEGARLVGGVSRTEDGPGRRSGWEMWKIDLLMIPAMWWIYSAPFSGPAIETSDSDPDGIIDGMGRIPIAMSAGFLAALFPGMKMMQRLQVGHVVAIAVLLYSGLQIGALFVNSLAGAIAISVIMGVARGLIVPGFVYMTGSWYTTREQVLRIIIWAQGSVMLQTALANIAWAVEKAGFSSVNIVLILTVVYAAISIVLGGLAYFFMRTPDQADWLPAQDRDRILDRQRDWSKAPWNALQIPTILKEPQTWLFFTASFLFSVFTTVQAFGFYVPDFWYTDLASFVAALGIGLLLSGFSQFRILTMSLLLCLGLGTTLGYSIQGHYWTLNDDGVDPNGARNTPVVKILSFLMSVSQIVQYLLWSLVLSNTHDITRRLVTICAVFSGYAIGGIAGSAYWIGEGLALYDRRMPPGFTPLISVASGLLLFVFAGWFLYYGRMNKRVKNGRRHLDPPEYSSDWEGTRAMLTRDRVDSREQKIMFTT